MHKAKRIFAIGDFKDHLTDSIRVICRQWVKGLIRLGHDVQRFTYRNIAFQYSISGSLPWLGKKKADKLLLKQIKSYYPDIILILTMKLIPERTVIVKIRRKRTLFLWEMPTSQDMLIIRNGMIWF